MRFSKDARQKRSMNGSSSQPARRLRTSIGLEVHAGHGLDYASAETISALPQVVELNIGHFLIGEAVFEGLAQTIKLMRAAMERGRIKRATAHDHRPRLRHLRRAADRAGAQSRTASASSTASSRIPSARRPTAAPIASQTYAKRFAAKEACAKALGTGFRGGVFWRDMGVVNLPSGKPTMQLTGGALERLQAITPAGHEARIDVSLTDEGPTAQAIVIIQALPLASPPPSERGNVARHSDSLAANRASP